MVDNEQLGHRKADDVEKETPLAGGTEHDKSVCAPSADTSDVLRQIVIDGSNIAMRFGFVYLQRFVVFNRYIIDNG